MREAPSQPVYNAAAIVTTLLEDVPQAPPTEIAPGMIKVCSKCWPGNSVYEAYPQYQGFEISHGICPAHAKEFIAYGLRHAPNAGAQKSGTFG